MLNSAKIFFSGHVTLAYVVSMLVIGCEENRNDNLDEMFSRDTVKFSNLKNLFKNNCYSCHSEEGFTFYGLNLDSYQNIMMGSSNGAVVVPFKPYESLLYTKCSGDFLSNTDLGDGGNRMPEDNRDYFDENPEDLELIYNWINDGCLE